MKSGFEPRSDWLFNAHIWSLWYATDPILNRIRCASGLVGPSYSVVLLFSHYVLADSFATPRTASLLCLWDFPGKNTGVGCYFLLHGCGLPGSTVHEIFQTRILEWVAIPFSRGSSWPGDQTQVSNSSIIGRFFIVWATKKAPRTSTSCPKVPGRKAETDASRQSQDIGEQPVSGDGMRQSYFSSYQKCKHQIKK